MFLLALLAAAFFSTAERAGEVEGVVTFHRPADPYFFLADRSNTAWRVTTADRRPRVKVGDRVQVKGVFPKRCAFRWIDQASFRKRGVGLPPPVREMDVEEMCAVGPDGDPTRRDWYGARIAVSGPILDVNRRETYAQLLIGTKQHSLQVVLPQRWDRPLPDGLVIGALVRAQGVGVYTALPESHVGPVTGIVNFNVLLEKPADLRVLNPPAFWTPLKVLGVFGGLAAVMLLVIAFIERQRVRERVMAEAARRERLRLTGELHDNFQQLLAGSMFRLGAAMGKVGKNDEAALKQLDLLRNSLNHTQTALRAALWELTEEAEGPAALAELFKYATSRMPQWEGKVKFTIRGRERAVARQCSGALLLILQEAIGNALRHGGATLVDVVVHFGEKKLVVGIKDNGSGFDPRAETQVGHLGLTSMRQHAEGLGGTLIVRSAPGYGTAIVVRIPL